MKTGFTAFWITLLNGLLVLLGFSGCKGDDGMRVEYGTPTATYKVRGQAVDGETKEPVRGLQAVFYQKYTDRDGRVFVTAADTVKTGTDGKFDLELHPGYARELYLKIEDIDGRENGLYRDKELAVDFTDAQYTGASGWYHGEAAKDIGTVPMAAAEGVEE